MSKTVVAYGTFISLFVLCFSCSNRCLCPEIVADRFLLQNGMYEFLTAIHFSNQEKEISETRIVNLENKNGNITIVDLTQTEYPILGKLDGKNFTATLNDAGGKVFFKGQLVGDNKLSGKLEGTSKNGEASVEGTFNIIMKGAH